jgi:hypothetical protein
MILILMRPLSFLRGDGRGQETKKKRKSFRNKTDRPCQLFTISAGFKKKRRREKLRNGESDAMSSTENGENKPLLLLLMVSLYVYNILQEIEDKRGKK